MRTVTTFWVETGKLERKDGARASDAARELVDLLLRQERLLWSDPQPIECEEIKQAFAEFAVDYPRIQGRPTDPESEPIAAFVRNFLGISVEQRELIRLGADAGLVLRYDALRHAISILAQLPEDDESDIDDLSRIVGDREAHVFGLLFQQEDRFRIRLRYHSPEALKEATERVVVAVAPRQKDDVRRLNDEMIKKAVTHGIAGVTALEVRFDEVLMRTPLGEDAQRGTVHPVNAGGGLVRYVGWRAPQKILLWLSLALLLGDVLIEAFAPIVTVQNLDLTKWIGGTLGRLTTAAFTAYFFAALLEYMRLRAKFRGKSAAFIDWTPV
jgi:hypothetical protein